jgi:hypothetical protein
LSSRVEKYSIETRQAVDEAIEDINREIANKQQVVQYPRAASCSQRFQLSTMISHSINQGMMMMIFML